MSGVFCDRSRVASVKGNVYRMIVRAAMMVSGDGDTNKKTGGGAGGDEEREQTGQDLTRSTGRAQAEQFGLS